MRVRGWRGQTPTVARMRRDYGPVRPDSRPRPRRRDARRAAERDWALARYRDNLRAIVRTAQAAGASVVLAGLAQNLSDHPPGASRHRRGLSDSRASSGGAPRCRRRRRAMQAQDWRAALDAAAHRPRASMRGRRSLHYMRGQCLEALGRFASARAAYRDASDRDAVPLGAPGAVNRVIEEVAERDRLRVRGCARRAGARPARTGWSARRCSAIRSTRRSQDTPRSHASSPRRSACPRRRPAAGRRRVARSPSGDPGQDLSDQHGLLPDPRLARQSSSPSWTRPSSATPTCRRCATASSKFRAAGSGAELGRSPRSGGVDAAP